MPFVKPRIFRRFGIWVCYRAYVYGHGYSPLEAYSDWRAQWLEVRG